MGLWTHAKAHVEGEDGPLDDAKAHVEGADGPVDDAGPPMSRAKMGLWTTTRPHLAKECGPSAARGRAYGARRRGFGRPDQLVERRLHARRELPEVGTLLTEALNPKSREPM